jgi:hypothetical protein
MFGKPVCGNDAPLGSLLLGYPNDDNQLCLAIPVDHDGIKHTLVVTEGGEAILPSHNWLEPNYWDVTAGASFHVEPRGFRISNNGIRPGEIGFDGADWFIAAPLTERARWSTWINVTKGIVCVAKPEKLIRFQRWTLTANDHDLVLFSHQSTMPIDALGLNITASSG